MNHEEDDETLHGAAKELSEGRDHVRGRTWTFTWRIDELEGGGDLRRIVGTLPLAGGIQYSLHSLRRQETTPSWIDRR